MAQSRRRRASERAFQHYFAPSVIRVLWWLTVLAAVMSPMWLYWQMEQQGLVERAPVKSLAQLGACVIVCIVLTLVSRLCLECIAVIFDIRAELREARLARMLD